MISLLRINEKTMTKKESEIERRKTIFYDKQGEFFTAALKNPIEGVRLAGEMLEWIESEIANVKQ